MKINVLGTAYKLIRVNDGIDEYMNSHNAIGYCDSQSKKIVVLNLKTVPNWKNEPDESIQYKEKETIRHELIHAFLNESGLQWSSGNVTAWARNEEMVDWFAIQFPKIIKAFNDADAI